MSNINNTDSNGSITPSCNTNKVYPENGRPPTSWGSQFSNQTKAMIVDDIYKGVATLEEMSEMLSVSKSHIKDWQRSYRPDVYGPPRRGRGRGYSKPKLRFSTDHLGTNGARYDHAKRVEIVSAIKSGAISIDNASVKYQVYRSILLRWCECAKYGKPSIPAKAIIQTPKSVSETDRIIAVAEYNRIVLDLLLSGSPDKALTVARAFLAIS